MNVILQEEEDVNIMWNNTKHVIQKTADEVLGHKRRERNEDWFDKDCERALRLKNEARQKMLQRRTRANCNIYEDFRKESKRINTRKKRILLNQKLEEMEMINTQNRSRDFYRSAKWIKQGFNPRLNSCKDEDGKLLGEENDVMKRWTQYFKEMLNAKIRSEDTVEKMLLENDLNDY